MILLGARVSSKKSMTNDRRPSRFQTYPVVSPVVE